PDEASFSTRRSSDLQKRHQETEASRMAWNALASRGHGAGGEGAGAVHATLERMATASSCIRKVEGAAEPAVSGPVDERGMVGAGDRQSTRLDCSHVE